MASSFGFAFDNPRFSDRIMSIEIIPNPAEADDHSDIDLPTGNCEPSSLGEDTSMYGEEHTGNNSMSDVEDGTASDNEEEDGNAIIVEKIISYLLRFKKSGDEAARKRVADGNTDSSTVLRVKTIHISSAILAKKSPFFYQLFSDHETREPGQRVTTLRIHDYEEASLMELLNFMYNDTLSMTTPSSLLDILMVADDFGVASCMRYCSQQLSKLPMNCESALAYLSLPSCVSHADALQQLTDSAKQFLAVKFRDIYQSYNEILDLPLDGIEAVLSSDYVQALHEDDVYDIVLKWAHLNYSQLKERQEILETRLCHLIRFPYMTKSKLQEATMDANISPGVASKFILEALFFKIIGRPCLQRQPALGSQDAGENSSVNRQFVQRSYLIQPVRVVEFELPYPHCVAYLNLRREECARLFPDWWNLSEGFCIGAQSFFLTAQCTMDVESLSQCFSLSVGLKEPISANVSIDFEFAARSREDQDEYKRLYKNSYTLTPQGAMVGCRNLFKTPWATFIDDDSPFFINGILYLRAVITIK